MRNGLFPHGYRGFLPQIFEGQGYEQESMEAPFPTGKAGCASAARENMGRRRLILRENIWGNPFLRLGDAAMVIPWTVYRSAGDKPIGRKIMKI